jgi:hypothetical protein
MYIYLTVAYVIKCRPIEFVAHLFTGHASTTRCFRCFAQYHFVIYLRQGELAPSQLITHLTCLK